MKRYDRAYFDRWYRDGGAAGDPGELERNVALAVAVAESVLGRPVETVLDVGCGEGRWEPALRALRPGVRYRGVDASEYAVERFGVERGITLGRFGDLPEMELPEPFDLVVCADVLHYLEAEEVLQGMDTLADLTGGAALVEVFTAEDPEMGDREAFHARPARWYRRVVGAAGLVAVGLQMYVHEEMAEALEALDLPARG